MKFSSKKHFFQEMNRFYAEKIPFFFIVDYAAKYPELIPLADLKEEQVFYKAGEITNYSEKYLPKKNLEWQKQPISKANYTVQFKAVQQAIQNGETYLINLTASTPVQTNYSLEELFFKGQGAYKLWFKDRFVHFSPEPFIKIKDRKVYTFPMKGTIDAAIDNAAEVILNDEKELREQYTIVDLLRNDLSIVADKVRVDDFRYIEHLYTNEKELLAVSSKISGQLKSEYAEQLGSVFEQLLPAGSICGAPKQRTCELIESIETHQRHYYTGVWGVFDGLSVDSCVIIRYLEKTETGLVFKSGGGITNQSELDAEYQELCDKVYLPIP